ncbi:hypothetical protein [Spirosoma radiotolerans]|uniref:Uncharacterized protein n=1 Tax=Spirosoma radiotolerans TaxID=1379870 RepID=A0A0E4A091_9BACT|nr:hypothetical protein [Spirosoma radiotolerans]AKD58053.1 hypothetical protein SD10_27260 [Spirosoma radiotolerans]
METTKEQKLEHIATIREQGSNGYKPEGIKRWGVERFLDAVSPKQPFQFGIDFTEEERNRK